MYYNFETAHRSNYGIDEIRREVYFRNMITILFHNTAYGLYVVIFELLHRDYYLFIANQILK